MPILEQKRSLKLAGGEIRIHADRFDTDGQFELFEFVVPRAYPGPGRHVHRQADEVFIILDGAGQFELGAESLIARVGDRVLVHHGVPHLFRNAGEGTLRMLVAFTPAIGMADYFVRLVDLLARSRGKPAGDELIALWERYDTVPA